MATSLSLRASQCCAYWKKIIANLVLYHSPGSRSGRVKALLDLMKVACRVVEIEMKTEANTLNNLPRAKSCYERLNKKIPSG